MRGFIFLAVSFVSVSAQEPLTKLVSVPHGHASRIVATETQCSLVPGGDWQNVHATAEVFRAIRRQADGSFWQWSPDAAHHRAAVRVKESSGAGSGICVATTTNHCVVLTNHHVVGMSRSVVIDWPGGAKARGNVVGVLNHNFEDLALIHVPNPDPNWVGLPIATREPPVGERLEMVGFGGPQYGRKRSFFGRRVGSQGYESRKAPLQIDAATISGDSGSGILWQGHIVGVNWGGFGSPTRYRGVELIHPACSGVSPTKLSHWIKTQCGPWGCQPIFSDPCGPGGGNGGGGFYNPPSQSPVDVQPSQPPTQPGGCGCNGNCDCKIRLIQDVDLEKIKADIVAAVIAKIPDPIPGPAGPQGPAGLPASISQADIDAIVATVLARTPQPTLDVDRITNAVMARMPQRSQRVLLVDGKSGKVLDDETYKDGEPIVIDFQRVANAQQ